jgi:hypothetical protein
VNNDQPHTPAPTPTYDGRERRRPDATDRRTATRGGRRATDVIRTAAGFIYKLLTEPPR